MATQSATKPRVKSCEARKVPPFSTMENPPGNEVSGGAWDVPEVDNCFQARRSPTTIAPSSARRRWDSWSEGSGLAAWSACRASRRFKKCACARLGLSTHPWWARRRPRRRSGGGTRLRQSPTRWTSCRKLGWRTKKTSRVKRKTDHQLPRGRHQWLSRLITLKATTCRQGQRANLSSNSRKSTASCAWGAWGTLQELWGGWWEEDCRLVGRVRGKPPGREQGGAELWEAGQWLWCRPPAAVEASSEGQLSEGRGQTDYSLGKLGVHVPTGCRPLWTMGGRVSWPRWMFAWFHQAWCALLPMLPGPSLICVSAASRSWQRSWALRRTLWGALARCTLASKPLRIRRPKPLD